VLITRALQKWWAARGGAASCGGAWRVTLWRCTAEPETSAASSHALIVKVGDTLLLPKGAMEDIQRPCRRYGLVDVSQPSSPPIPAWHAHDRHRCNWWVSWCWPLLTSRRSAAAVLAVALVLVTGASTREALQLVDGPLAAPDF